MKRKTAKADVPGFRQESQFTCMAASLAGCLKAHGKDQGEADVNKVMGAGAMRGATWEDLTAAAQYFGMRSTLVIPSTVNQLREWTDAGTPVVIAYNPEGRPWSHASVVFDVTGEGADTKVHIMDPNIPDPDETVRVMSKADFYKVWGEPLGDKMIVRRPACAIEREVTAEGKQVMASQKTAARLALSSGKKDESATRWLSQAKITAKNRGDMESAVVSAAYYAKKQDRTMFVYSGNSYGHALWRVSADSSEYLNPINNTGNRVVSVTPDHVVYTHDIQGQRPLMASSTRVASRSASKTAFPKSRIQKHAGRAATVVRDTSGRAWHPKRGLEGPFKFKSGIVLYYDPREGRYYDPSTDMYIDNEVFFQVTGEYSRLATSAARVASRYAAWRGPYSSRPSMDEMERAGDRALSQHHDRRIVEKQEAELQEYFDNGEAETPAKAVEQWLGDNGYNSRKFNQHPDADLLRRVMRDQLMDIARKL